MTSLPGAPPARRTAVITGGSGGIGLALARCFARGGFDLVLAARGEESLARTAAELRGLGASVTTVPVDLGRREDVERLLATLQHSAIDVDILVNNAGFGLVGAFAATELETELSMIALNVAALTHLTKGVLPGMLARGRGRILNVASTAAFQPGPYLAVYYATKAYVLSFSEAVAEELRGTGVTMTVLCPGPTVTGFAARAGMLTSRAFSDAVTMTAADVAKAGYEATLRGDRVVVPGTANRIVSRAVGFMPRGLVTRLGRRLNRDRDRPE